MADQPKDERRDAIQDVVKQATRVATLHSNMLRGHVVTESDAMHVRRLIRTLVAEWV